MPTCFGLFGLPQGKFKMAVHRLHAIYLHGHVT